MSDRCAKAYSLQLATRVIAAWSAHSRCLHVLDVAKETTNKVASCTTQSCLERNGLELPAFNCADTVHTRPVMGLHNLQLTVFCRVLHCFAILLLSREFASWHHNTSRTSGRLRKQRRVPPAAVMAQKGHGVISTATLLVIWLLLGQVPDCQLMRMR
eukprot:scaffold79122_cov31-Prasinocladus_malaysianus.AAC.1